MEPDRHLAAFRLRQPIRSPARQELEMPRTPERSILRAPVGTAHFARPLGHVLLGVGLFGMGAAIALVLPPALTGVALIVALLRICWLEDNIKSDLLDAVETPANHRQPRAERNAFLGADAPAAEDPALLATALRGQIQALSTLAYGAVGILLSVHTGWVPGVALAALLAAIWLGFRRADRLVLTIVHLEHGRPLPPNALSRPYSWAHSWRMDGGERDG
jgi:hypothetical protein